MPDPLRPMNLGAILDRAIQLFRAQPLLFIVLGAIPGLATLAYQLASVHPAKALESTPAHIGLVAASYLASFLCWVAQVVLGPISTAAVCLAVSRINLGERITIGEALGRFLSKAGRLFGLSFLQGLFAGWPFIIAAIVAAIIGGATMATGGASATYIIWSVMLLGAIPCIALYTRYALAFPATAIENLTATESIDRSVALSEGGRWRICWGFLVPLVPSSILSLGTLELMEYLKESKALLANNPLIVAAINGGVDLISTLIFTPYTAIVMTLLYYDQRIRREAFDVERMMTVAGLDGNPEPTSPPATLPPVGPLSPIPPDEAPGA